MNSAPAPVSGFLRIHDLYKSYGSRRILDNVDLEVAAGELCTVVGPSGCGKSTLLRQILGEEQPDGGSVELDGQDVGYPDTRRGIVFQRYSLYPHLSVLDNVTLGPRLAAGRIAAWRQRREIRERALEDLARVRMAEHARQFPHELSGGMQQRVAIAQALALRPKVLLMDEPFGALDPDTREQMQLFLLELWERERMTVFFVTHDLEEACFLGTRVLVLSQYYRDDRGDGHPQRGAKIIADYALPRAASATEIKSDPQFAALTQRIRDEGFDPANRRHVAEFNLHHPHAFRTLTDDELRPPATGR